MWQGLCSRTQPTDPSTMWSPLTSTPVESHPSFRKCICHSYLLAAPCVQLLPAASLLTQAWPRLVPMQLFKMSFQHPSLHLHWSHLRPSHLHLCQWSPAGLMPSSCCQHSTQYPWLRVCMRSERLRHGHVPQFSPNLFCSHFLLLTCAKLRGNIKHQPMVGVVRDGSYILLALALNN